MTKQHEHDEQGAPVALRLLRRRLGVLIACAILIPAAAVAFSLAQQKQYSATASLLFRDPQFDQKLFGSTFIQQSGDPARQAATNVRLVSLEVVASRTSRALGGRPSAGDIAAGINVAPAGQSDVANITATNSDPQLAARIANTFAQQFIAFRREADRSKISSAQQLVQEQLRRLPAAERKSPEGTALSQRAEQLQILAALQTGNAELVQPAQPPSSPSSPKPIRNGAIGLLFGLLFGVAVALLLERLDRRLSRTEDIAEAFDRPVLGAIPESRTIAKSQGRDAALAPAEAESFRMLRASLRYFNVDRKITSVLITSAAPAEGKSTVAIHLASAAASAGQSVLLLEADLRRPTIARRLGISPGVGLSQVLAGDVPLSEATQAVAVTSGAFETTQRTLDVLVSGPIPPNPADLIESERMRKVITHAEGLYDLVIVDTPPTSVVSDAIPLVKEMSGVIVVTRLGRTTRESASHLRSQLENLDANILGVVVNSAGKTGGYGYGYGYERPLENAAKVRGEASQWGEAGQGMQHGGRRVGPLGDGTQVEGETPHPAEANIRTLRRSASEHEEAESGDPSFGEDYLEEDPRELQTRTLRGRLGRKRTDG